MMAVSCRRPGSPGLNCGCECIASTGTKSSPYAVLLSAGFPGTMYVPSA